MRLGRACKLFLRSNTHLALLAVLLFFAGGFLSALDAVLISAETDVVIRTDGKADVYYSLEWKVREGEMHGFFFQGTGARPVFNYEKCFADMPDGTRIALEITDLGSGKYDILLAGGRGFSGRAFFFLNYGADLGTAGLIGVTRSDQFGNLFYFDWAPVVWDYPLEHKTVRVIFPIEVKSKNLSHEDVETLGVRTEPYVNEENSIDYYGTVGNDDRYYFTIRFHQEDVPASREMRLQCYLPSGLLGMMEDALRERVFKPEYTGSRESSDRNLGFSYRRLLSGGAGEINSPFYIYLGLMLAFLIFLYWRKNRGFPRAVEEIEGIRWAGDNWTPPKLVVGSYRVPGKVPDDLHPVEAALLLEMPLPSIVAILVAGSKLRELFAK